MEFEFREPPKLAWLSPEVLAGVGDDELESALIGYFVERVIDMDDEAELVAALPPAQRSWYVAFVVDAEVLNGGFNQLFFNLSGALAPLAPAAFTELGVPDAGELVRRALDLLEVHVPVLEAAQEAGTIDAFIETYLDQPFSELDDAYAERQEEWRLARVAFIRRRAAEFAHPGANA
jgi:hypothetical protein